MENIDVFKRTVQECTDIRRDLNENWWKKMRTLSNIFKLMFERESNNEFKFLNDLFYYQGGYPTPNTPPKMQSLVESFATMLKFFTYSGNEDAFKHYLEAYGINAEIINTDECLKNDKIANFNKVRVRYETLFNEPMPMNKKDLFNKMISMGQSLQHTICVLADLIKLDAADKIKTECNISKQNFINAISINVTKSKLLEKNANLDKVIKKVDDRKQFSTEIVESVSIFEKDDEIDEMIEQYNLDVA